MVIKHFSPEKYDLDISIEFPNITDCLIPGSRTAIRNMQDPERATISTVNAMTIYVSSGSMIWAELEMYADLEGKPLLSGKPYIQNDQIVTGVFLARVLEVRSGYSYHQGYRVREGAVHV